jgi:hypothetical protein
VWGGEGTSAAAVTYRSPTLLIPTTTRSFLRQNSTSVCASVTGSSLTQSTIYQSICKFGLMTIDLTS